MDEIHEAQEEWIKANHALTQFAAANGGVIAFKAAIAICCAMADYARARR